MIVRWLAELDLKTSLPDGQHEVDTVMFDVEGGEIVDVDTVSLGDEPDGMAASVATLLTQTTSGAIEVQVVCLDYDDGWWGWRVRGEVGAPIRTAWMKGVEWYPWKTVGE